MSEQPAMDASRLHDLLRESAQWRLLGLLFEPPREDWREELKSLAAEVGDEPLAACAHQARQEADSGLYHSTFGPGGPACPREVSHRVTLVPGAILSELEAYYQGFGYQPTCPEAPDHVAVEAGFMAFLRLKQAYAMADGSSDQAEMAAAAAHRFLTEHLAVMAEPLARSLTNSGIAYLAAASAALRSRTGPALQLPLTAPESQDEADEYLDCV